MCRTVGALLLYLLEQDRGPFFIRFKEPKSKLKSKNQILSLKTRKPLKPNDRRRRKNYYVFRAPPSHFNAIRAVHRTP